MELASYLAPMPWSGTNRAYDSADQEVLMKKLVLILVILAFASSAQAAPMYFSNRALFQAAVTGTLSLESFEGPGQVAATHTYADFQVSETGGIDIITNYLANSSYVQPVTHGQNAIWFDDNGSSIGTFFNFTGGGVYAFGLDITADEATTVSIGGGLINSSVVLASQVPQFWGVIDTSLLAAVTFDASGGPNIGFDYVEYQLNQSVPDPGSSLLLLGIGIAGLRAWRKRLG
jgi:hypothetical protein